MFENTRRRVMHTEEGESVPTIRAAFETDQELAKLLPEIHKFTSEERSAFAQGLDRAISDLELDKPLPSDAAIFAKTYGMSAIGGIVGLGILTLLTGPLSVGAIAGPMGGALYYGSSEADSAMADKKTKEHVLGRMRMLRAALRE